MNTPFLKSIKNAIKYWYIPLLVGLFFVIVSIVVFTSPLTSFGALAILFSLSFLFGGTTEIFFSVTNRDQLVNWGWSLAAIGARESDIPTQFLIEAIVLSLAGGLIGVVLGVTGNFIIYKATNFYIPTAFYSILIGFGFSALIGIAFGFFPARKAAKLNPIDALRYE